MFHPHGRWCWLGLLVLAALDTPRAQTHVHPGTHPSVPAAAVAPSGGNPNTDTTDPASRWRAANEAVGAFPRGHADILRWERAQGLVRAPAPGPSPDAVWTLDDVARHALRARPDLLIGPGLGARERWEREQAAALAVRDAQAAWIDAIAARQTRQLAEAALEAAAIGAELAQRMQHVGNFSAQRALVETLPTWEARQRLRQARTPSSAP
ncbi:hypothetical protein Tther_02142 [Tepidimonas thermarum]|uniref:Uncharacterized protein n=1 Tax=Tepidimonas thermarum TaxID=335431 RepID=A0A554WXP9_9BURK|nr:hypothetical protein [Tepidimonas thermarum]TSE28347.1 hypothetical protein Tther_02142 [Tepidimonas thermarum]